MKPCPTPGCKGVVEYVDQRWCNDCTGVVLRTGRPPGFTAEPRRPAWLVRAAKQPHGLARDLTRSHAA